jgi:hypothetical protein
MPAPPCVAVICAVPAPTPVARPLLALIVAADVLEEVQRTLPEMSWVVPSL